MRGEPESLRTTARASLVRFGPGIGHIAGFLRGSSTTPRRRRLGPWQVAAALALLLMLPLAVRLALDSGISWDEEKHLEYGRRLLEWYRSGFTDRSSFTFMDLYVYGGLFDLPAQVLNSSGLSPWGPYETRHVLTAMLAVLGIVAVWKTANRIAGPRAALCAAVMLALTPAWVGHGMFNCKDIPFATAAAFVAYATTCIAMQPSPLSWGSVWRVGFAVGCALGFRPGGMFLFAFPLLAAVCRLMIDVTARKRRGEPLYIARDGVASTRLLVAVPLAWALMLVAWPWALQSPVLRPLEAAGLARHFAWGGTMRFNGGLIRTDNIPASYLPIWFKVTLPDIYALAMLCAVTALAVTWWRSFRSPRTLAIALLVSAVVGPYLGVVVTHPVIYDAHRHFLFLLPPMAVLTGLAIDGFIGCATIPRAIRALAVVLILGTGAVSIYDMRGLHPYEYIYFNRLSGGLRHQASRFETDYWGLSYREAFEWVVRRFNGARSIHVTACNINGPLRYYRDKWNVPRFVVEERAEQSQISIAMLRGECRDMPGTVIHTVEREGVPLAFVRRRAPGSSR